MSHAVAGLTQKGLVDKFHAKSNNRTRYIKLTPLCEKSLSDQETSNHKFLAENFNGLFTDEELDLFIKTHHEINDFFDKI